MMATVRIGLADPKLTRPTIVGSLCASVGTTSSATRQNRSIHMASLILVITLLTLLTFRFAVID